MFNLNKIYHKGKYRSSEWAKHLRPYLKRIGNKRFRKDAFELEETELIKYRRARKKLKKKSIRVKITIKTYGNSTFSYSKNYRTMKDVQNSIKRPNVIRYNFID